MTTSFIEIACKSLFHLFHRLLPAVRWLTQLPST